MTQYLALQRALPKTSAAHPTRPFAILLLVLNLAFLVILLAAGVLLGW